MCTGENTNGVHNGLRSTRARQRLHNQRITGGNLGHDVLLLSICIEQQSVRCRWTFVLTDNDSVLVFVGEASARGDVASERIQDGVSELLNVRHHRGGEIREARGNQARLHLEVTQVLGQSTQTLNHR